MRRLYVGVLALLRIDAATIDAVRRTSNIAVFGSTNASHAQHYAATFASLRCGGHADRFLFLDEPAPASAVALAAIGVHVIVADGTGAASASAPSFATAQMVFAGFAAAVLAFRCVVALRMRRARLAGQLATRGARKLSP